jgi:signal transduction histidine kinase
VKVIDKITAGQNQLRWVVLLLAIAVVLPTVCLLWFMSHAVKNERLAVRQKLTDVYQQRLDGLSKKLDGLWTDRINSVGAGAAGLEAVEMVGFFAGAGNSPEGMKLCDAAIVYDSNDRLLYPIATGKEDPSALPEEFNSAWRAEFIDEDYARATGLYEQIAASAAADYVRNSALMGKVRCLRKSGDIDKAVAQCEELAYGQNRQGVNPSSASLIARARVLFIELKSQTKDSLGRPDVQKLIDSAVNYTDANGSDFLPMPSETRIFLLRKAIEIIEKSPWSQEFGAEVPKAKELLSTEELAAAFLNKYGGAEAAEPWSEDNALKLISSLRVLLNSIEGVEWNYSDFAEQLRRQISIVLDSYQARQAAALAAMSKRSALATLLESWPEDSFRRLDLPQEVFAVHHTAGGRTYILLRKAESLKSDLNLCSDGLEELGISCRILDGSGKCISGSETPNQAAFLHAPLGKFFPGWRAEIRFSDVDIFEKTANRQKMIYIWAGLLAIGVMVAAGLATAQTVGKQIKINKLKNDFIATVSHELKTPLASMRVLVDTLLEGSYRDQQQVTEYLELVSKENERLTGLIDNFLTFSRMERNKQAFAMARTSPAAIARDAAGAVKTKFGKGRCSFEVNIRDELPDVNADRDAMVTVLVNLLDNAYKYSYDDKRIELSVSREDGSVCFRVTDNGAGISRRSVKKIFNRFYQVDRSLSRRAEGCGLGLSIAKFIVDAHKGTISVESKPGQGSTFTVKLPVGN